MKRIFFIFCFELIYGASFSQQLSLSDAVAIALKNSLNIKIAKNTVEIAKVSNSYGYAGGLPLVNATATDQEQLMNLKQEYSNPANNKQSSNAASNILSTGLNASVLVYNGQRVVTAKKRLGVIESQSKVVLSSKALVLVYNVMLKYFDIVRQQGYARTLERSIEASKQKLEIVKTQQSVGLANNADLFQSQVDLNSQIQNLLAQQLVVDQDKTDLLTLLTLRPDSVINVNDTIIVDKSIQLDSILAAVGRNPDIEAANEQIQINHYIEKEVGAQRYPALTLGAGYNYNQTKNAAGFSLLNQSYGPYTGLTLSVPIFNGNIFKKQQQIAEINSKNATLLRDTLLLGYNSNTVKSYQAYTSNLQQLETAKTNFDLSQKLLALVIQRFQLRQATIVDVKNAQESFENAGYILVNVSYAAKASEIQLKRIANELDF